MRLKVVTLTATVAPANPGSGMPTGTVSFYDSGTLLGTITLSGGSAALTISTLNVGMHSITAVYSGDPLFTTNFSNPFTETIT